MLPNDKNIILGTAVGMLELSRRKKPSSQQSLTQFEPSTRAITPHITSCCFSLKCCIQWHALHIRVQCHGMGQQSTRWLSKMLRWPPFLRRCNVPSALKKSDLLLGRTLIKVTRNINISSMAVSSTFSIPYVSVVLYSQITFPFLGACAAAISNQARLTRAITPKHHFMLYNHLHLSVSVCTYKKLLWSGAMQIVHSYNQYYFMMALHFER